MHRAHLTLNNFSEETSDSRSTALRNSSHNSFGTDSPPLVNSPDHISDSLSETSKKIRKKRNTYQKIDDASRMRLLDAVQQGETLKAAAKRQGINYSSAKSILHTYRKEGRIFKKSAQERIAKKRTKASSDLEMSPIYPYKQQLQGFDGVSESPAGFNAMDFQQKTQVNGLTEGNANGVTINSFGDFLKVDSQGRAKSDNSFTSSTITLKLDAQKFQRLPANNNNVSVPTLMFNNTASGAAPATTTPQCVTSNTRNIQSGNWQLNVNVHTENPQKNTKSLNLKDGSQFTYTYTTRPAEPATRTPEPFSMNFTTSMKKDVPEYDPRLVNKQYDNANHMITTANTENHYPQEEQNYDVSCFLNSSSPAYSFPQRANNAGMEQIVDNSGENNAHQRYYEGSYLNSFGQKLEQGTPGMMKTASLRSY